MRILGVFLANAVANPYANTSWPQTNCGRILRTSRAKPKASANQGLTKGRYERSAPMARTYRSR